MKRWRIPAFILSRSALAALRQRSLAKPPLSLPSAGWFCISINSLPSSTRVQIIVHTKPSQGLVLWEKLVWCLVGLETSWERKDWQRQHPCRRSQQNFGILHPYYLLISELWLTGNHRTVWVGFVSIFSSACADEKRWLLSGM